MSTRVRECNVCDINILPTEELRERLQTANDHCSTLENSKKELESLVEKLELSLKEQVEKCKALEEDRTFLRKTIRKASANWFEKKARLSDSENETNSDSPQGDALSDVDRTEIKEPSLISKEEAIQVFADLKFKTEQVFLAEKRCTELSKRLKDYEQVIDDQEVIIHGMKDQLDTYFDDNQKMSRQLKEFTRLFQELENINEKDHQNPPAKPEVSVQSNQDLPTQADFKVMSKSVSKTYVKLKELIYEKKSLVTEIERLRTLNIELQHRVSQQENRLMNVSDALQTTWLLVSNLKDEHAKIHTNESILRYQLREKREILQKLREELECSREQWHTIREKNTETEQEWTTLRRELNERRRAETMKKITQPTEDPCSEACAEVETSDCEFEPPIDLLLDMGIECGVVDADDEESTTCVALMGGQDVHAERLQNLEDQCCQLYQKLMTSTSRALTLASRLTSLHEQYAMSEDDDDEDFLDEDDEDFEGEIDLFQSVVSPDSESIDTAYVSEPEILDSNFANEAVQNHEEEETALSSVETPETSGIEEGTSPYESSLENGEDPCDLLSKRLINFLPKKIELLRADNKKLEEKYQFMQEEKLKMEALLTASIEFERRQRKQLEEQLSHLGKYVDELHLERNGKIAKKEEDLEKKMEELDNREAKFRQNEQELESLNEKHEQRGELLQLTALQLQQSESRAVAAEEALNKFKIELDNLHKEIDNFKLKGKVVKEKCIGENSKGSQTQETKGLFLSKIQVSNPASLRYKGESPISIGAHNQDREILLRSRMNFDPNLIHLPNSLILAQNSEFRYPFHLKVGSTLNWEFKVSPHGVRFHIIYDQYPQNPETKPTHKSCEEVQSSQDTIQNVTNLQLLNPVYVCSSESSTKGRIIPRMSGQFSLVFCNPLAKTQELQVRATLSNNKPEDCREPPS